MAQDHAFDIVSKVDYAELTNAINQALKEIQQRFDLKDTNSKIELLEKDAKIHLQSSDEFKLKSVLEILKNKLVKRSISLKILDPGKVESALGGTAKLDIKILQGLDKDRAKIVTADIKALNLKVQTQIQGDQIRATAKQIDDLQTIIKVLRSKDYAFPLQFLNFR